MTNLAILCYWYNINGKNQNGYELVDYNNDDIYCCGTYSDCLDYAKENNIKIVGC